MIEEKEPTLKDIFEVVSFIKDNAVTRNELKDDLKSFATKKDIEVLTKELKLEIGKARDEAFAYADKKSVAIVAKLDEIIDKHEEHENKFKHGLVSAMKHNSLLGVKELKHLEQVI